MSGDDPTFWSIFILTFAKLAVLFLVASGVALILQAKRISAHLAVLAFVAVAVAVLGPDLIHTVPWYVLLGFGVLIGLGLLGQFLALFIGRGAANSAVGTLTANLILAVALPFILPFRLLRRLLSRDSGAG